MNGLHRPIYFCIGGAHVEELKAEICRKCRYSRFDQHPIIIFWPNQVLRYCALTTGSILLGANRYCLLLFRKESLKKLEKLSGR